MRNNIKEQRFTSQFPLKIKRDEIPIDKRGVDTVMQIIWNPQIGHCYDTKSFDAAPVTEKQGKTMLHRERGKTLIEYVNSGLFLFQLIQNDKRALLMIQEPQSAIIHVLLM